MTSARILIVEDESIVAKDLRQSLNGLGYTVIGAVATGEDAVKQAAELKPDLILMDVMLKGAMDGIDAAAKIRELHSIPVIYLTAYTDDETLLRAKQTEAWGYLLKPFEDRELRTTIEMALYKHTMERKLRESHEWLQTALRCIRDAVLVADAGGFVQFMNAAAEMLTGWRQIEAVGRKLTDVLCLMKEDATDLVEKAWRDAIERGVEMPMDSDARLIARDGRQAPVEHSFALLRDDQGCGFGVVVGLRDITEQQKARVRERQLQERIYRSQRMESLGSMAGGVAHRLSGILSPMVAYPDLIVKNLPQDSIVRKDIAIIGNSVRKAMEVVGDLLTLGGIGQCPLEQLNFNGVLERFLHSDMIAKLPSDAPLAVFEHHFEDNLPPIMGAEGLLLDMLRNLLRFLIDAMPEGGRLALSVAPVTLREPLAGYEIVAPDHYLVLRLADSAGVFGESDLNRMFEPFFVDEKNKQNQRSGLEMAIVYSVIKAHNGFIDVRSAAEQGSEFIIYLPAAGALTPARADTGNLDVRGTETILVVDDDDEQHLITARWLRSMGYKVLTAHNGRAAVELVQAAAHTQGPPINLVLLDMIMADDFDGLDTYKKMLEFNPRQKAVVVSGFALTDRTREAIRLGAGRHLQKPFEIEELGLAVRGELDRA